MDAQLSGLLPATHPTPGELLHNGAMVMCVSGTHILAISPTGAFAIWVFRVTADSLMTTNGEYFQDLDEAAAAWKKIT
jgi:hypothetical protein